MAEIVYLEILFIKYFTEKQQNTVIPLLIPYYLFLNDDFCWWQKLSVIYYEWAKRQETELSEIEQHQAE